MRWVVMVSVQLALCFVWIAGHMIVTSIYYRGKSDGWVDGFDSCKEIIYPDEKPAAQLGLNGDQVEWYSIDGHCFGNCPDWANGDQ